MPNVVQRQPTGLLALLNAPGNDRAPSVLPDSVQPVIDLRPFYELTQNFAASVETPGATNVGDNAELVVPAGEIWIVKVLGLTAHTFSAACTARFDLTITPVELAAATACMDDVQATIAAANDQCSGGQVIPGGLPLSAGSRINARLKNDLGAVTCTIICRAIFARIRSV